MKKSSVCWIGLVTAILFLFSFAGCDTESEGSDIPDDVAELGGGAIELVGEVISIALDYGDYTTTGMTITSSDSGGTAILTNYRPYYESPITVTGTIVVTVLSTNPIKLQIAGNCTLGNSDFSTLSITGTATWAKGDDMDDEPQSYSGSITIDGTKYSIDDMMDAVEDLEDD